MFSGIAGKMCIYFPFMIHLFLCIINMKIKKKSIKILFKINY